jgi:hypothetical protein
VVNLYTKMKIGVVLQDCEMMMRPQSAKAKGRRLQQQFRELLIEELGIHPEDIESRSMGAGGEDLIMERAAREKFPYSIECKNVEKLNVWEAYKQASENSKDYEPLVVMKKNNHKTLVVLDAESFVKLFKNP